MDAIEGTKALFREKIDAQLTPVIPEAIAISLPPEDAYDELEILGSGDRLLTEGQYFIIEYRDAAGQLSVRPISVYSIRTNAKGAPSFLAMCHKRESYRSFRLDRICTVFDDDGVAIQSLPTFYRDTFGIVWPIPGLTIEHEDEGVARQKLIRRICRESGVALLAAVSLADHQMCENEVGEILEFCIGSCIDQGLEPTETEIEATAAYIRRMRPNYEAVSRAIDRMVGYDAKRIQFFLTYCARVMDADGFQHHRERKMLDEFCQALTGISLDAI